MAAKKDDEPKPIKDKKLVEMAKARETLRLRKKDLESEIEKLDKPILAELARRGTKSIEAAGVKVTKVEQPWTSYSYEILKQVLGKKAGRYRKKEVDVTALSQAIQAGEVPASVLEEITLTGLKAPYVSVTLTGPS